jgi:hypothetical protein
VTDVRTYSITLAATIEAQSSLDADRAAAEMAASIGAVVSQIRDVTAPLPGERRCEKCGGPNDLPPADRDRIKLCTSCLRASSWR